MNSLKHSLDFTHILSQLDWLVFIFIIVITIVSVIWGQRRLRSGASEKETLIDHLIMGRKLTLPLFVATLVATWYGGIFGVTRISFEKGIYSFLTQGIFWYIAYILFAFFIVNKVSHYQALTLPDLIGKMFGPKSGKLSGIFNFFNVLPIAYVISLGILIQTFTGYSLLISMFIGVFFVLIYSIWGGLRSVVFSDLIQFFVMCAAVVLVIVFSVFHFGGLDFLRANLPETHFSPTGGQSLAVTLVWGFIALSTLVDPNFYQRCFAAKSPKVAKKGILISTLVWVCFDICTTLGGMYAAATIPQAQPNQAYLIYALQVLPDGLRGFALAGIVATILSTLDSYLFLAGTTISYDLAPKKLRNKVSTQFIGTILVGVLSIFLATVFDGNIKNVWKTLGSYSASCLLLPVIYGYIFPQKIKDNQFVFSCLLGVIATTVWRNMERSGFWVNIDEIYAGMLFTSLGILLYPIFRKNAERI
ncbi:sodium:solute symporter family protein [Bacteriovoracaceae bacterium]|nr:sodium:solute symporter family protein [Bacteriovoracaceae bacterium]